jgi:hypothetical protein
VYGFESTIFTFTAWPGDKSSVCKKTGSIMFKNIRLAMLLLLLSISVLSKGFAQNKFTISGTVKDKSSNELLFGATLSVMELPSVGVVTNEYGFYSLTLPQGDYTISVSYLGYAASETKITLNGNQKMDFFLIESNILNEVVVTAAKKDDNLTQTKMGTEVLSMREIAKVPVLFGEKDILKIIQLLPGVKSNGEGNSGFTVRGGSTDQNLILLDEAPVYNASHLLGFFSTFNSDAIKDATLIKGNSPAQYGGRLSSVLDVKMKEGNSNDFGVSGGIGLISSRLTVEGPVQKGKSSFILSGRRTYADVFLGLSEDFANNSLYFYDYNAKMNYQINENNHLFLSGYFGRDVLGFANTFGIDWGNSTGTLRWNSVLSSKLFSNTSLIYSQYNYKIQIGSGETNFNINSRIEDWNLKQDFSYFPNQKNTLKFGFNAILHNIEPTRFEGSVESSTTKNNRPALENAVYVNNLYQPNPKLGIDYGLRLTSYSLIGEGLYNIYENGVITNSIQLESGEFGKTYFNIEPRISANYRTSPNSSLKAGYARNTQNLHLLSNSTGGNPTDQWIGSSYNIKPEIADQVSIGFNQNLHDHDYEIGIEAYYKFMQNQVDYKDAADINTALDVESELLFGKGRAYGIEFLAKKKTGKLTGWVSYTLAKTERNIEGINNGNWYNARQDRTHDLSVVALYQLTPRWNVSGLFVFYTGNAVTFPTGKYQVGGQTVYQYGSRNGDRMPAYHRLDLSTTYDFKPKKRYQSSLNLGVYNVYGQQNPFSIDFRENENDPNSTEAVQTALFRWMPAITYNFKF